MSDKQSAQLQRIICEMGRQASRLARGLPMDGSRHYDWKKQIVGAVRVGSAATAFASVLHSDDFSEAADTHLRGLEFFAPAEVYNELVRDLCIALRVLGGFVHCSVRDNHVGCWLSRREADGALWIPLDNLGSSKYLKARLHDYEQSDVFRVFCAFGTQMEQCPALPKALFRIQAAHECTWNVIYRTVCDESLPPNNFFSDFAEYVTVYEDEYNLFEQLQLTENTLRAGCDHRDARSTLVGLLLWMSMFEDSSLQPPLARADEIGGIALPPLDRFPPEPRPFTRSTKEALRAEFERLTAQVRSIRQERHDEACARGDYVEAEALEAEFDADRARRLSVVRGVAKGAVAQPAAQPGDNRGGNEEESEMRLHSDDDETEADDNIPLENRCHSSDESEPPDADDTAAVVDDNAAIEFDEAAKECDGDSSDTQSADDSGRPGGDDSDDDSGVDAGSDSDEGDEQPENGEDDEVPPTWLMDLPTTFDGPAEPGDKEHWKRLRAQLGLLNAVADNFDLGGSQQEVRICGKHKAGAECRGRYFYRYKPDANLYQLEDNKGHTCARR